ncbi:MAG TPA: hypothetical protein PKA63_12415 [Oligoflexia bacterium]|nr:hypothetical protein [Oligoflexia bacterium]HMP49460.1 hypothetical protein [Oligoflexia bacterium]
MKSLRVVHICNSILLLLVFSSCGVINLEDRTHSSQISRNVKLINEIMALYGNSALAKFEIESGLTPPIKDCHKATLTGVAKNPPANSNVPAEQASLAYQVYCLQCNSLIGRTFTRKITGTVEGIELKGSHTHIRGATDEQAKDRFGLSVSSGASGIVNIFEITTKHCEWWNG